MRTEAQKAADKRYNQKIAAEGRYTQLRCNVKTHEAKKFKSKCAEQGTTVNAVLTAAVKKFMEE